MTVKANHSTDKEKMIARDSISPSPEQRANYVYKRLGADKIHPWDLICFCCETFAMLASKYEFLKPMARHIVSVVYTAHYHTPEIYPSSCLIQLPSNQVQPQENAKQSLMVEKSDQQSAINAQNKAAKELLLEGMEAEGRTSAVRSRGVMGFFKWFFARPAPASPASSSRSQLDDSLVGLPTWLLLLPSTHPPAESAACGAGVELGLKWEELFHTACIASCLFAIGSLSQVSEQARASAMQRVFQTLSLTDEEKKQKVEQCMDDMVPKFNRGIEPAEAWGGWLLGKLAIAEGSTAEIRKMAILPEAVDQHGALVMSVTTAWVQTLARRDRS